MLPAANTRSFLPRIMRARSARESRDCRAIRAERSRMPSHSATRAPKNLIPSMASVDAQGNCDRAIRRCPRVAALRLVSNANCRAMTLSPKRRSHMSTTASVRQVLSPGAVQHSPLVVDRGSDGHAGPEQQGEFASCQSSNSARRRARLRPAARSVRIRSALRAPRLPCGVAFGALLAPTVRGPPLRHLSTSARKRAAAPTSTHRHGANQLQTYSLLTDPRKIAFLAFRSTPSLRGSARSQSRPHAHRRSDPRQRSATAKSRSIQSGPCLTKSTGRPGRFSDDPRQPGSHCTVTRIDRSTPAGRNDAFRSRRMASLAVIVLTRGVAPSMTAPARSRNGAAGWPRFDWPRRRSRGDDAAVPRRRVRVLPTVPDPACYPVLSVDLPEAAYTDVSAVGRASIYAGSARSIDYQGPSTAAGSSWRITFPAVRYSTSSASRRAERLLPIIAWRYQGIERMTLFYSPFAGARAARQGPGFCRSRR